MNEYERFILGMLTLFLVYNLISGTYSYISWKIMIKRVPTDLNIEKDIDNDQKNKSITAAQKRALHHFRMSFAFALLLLGAAMTVISRHA